MKSPSLIRNVRLRTSEASAMAAFYEKLLGVVKQPSVDGKGYALSHPISGETLLTLVADPDARLNSPRAPGLFHVAFLFPHLADWQRHTKRALETTVEGAADNGVSWALYLQDPDGNGIELYWDKPKSQWPRHGQQVAMVTEALPLREALRAEADASEGKATGDFSIGHLHLSVSDLAQARDYQQHLAIEVTQGDYPGALFMARDGYHHHLAVNTWRARPGIIRQPHHSGLLGWEMSLPAGQQPKQWIDPMGNEVRLVVP